MLDFQIFEETDSGLFRRCPGAIYSALNAETALEHFIVNHKPYISHKDGERFIVLRVGDPTACHLLKLVAPPHTWDVVSA